MQNDRVRTHLKRYRADLMNQARLFAAGDAHRIERRDGELVDATEERLAIIVGQAIEIDRVLRNAESQSEA